MPILPLLLLLPLLCLLLTTKGHQQQHPHPHHHHRHHHSAWHSLYHGRGDIAALWPQPPPDIQQQPSVMRNALRPDAPNRWTDYRNDDDDGGDDDKYLIPYVIVGTFSLDDEHRIMQAMANVAKNSCIRFRPRGAEADYLQIRNDRDQGCYSTTVGRLPGAANIINLESNECIKCAGELGLILHELFHVVGLWHEHQRWDRHRYIRIHHRNALPGTQIQLIKAPRDKVTRYGVPYDYRSVMHYPKDGFARFPGLVVLETLAPAFQDVIGHAKHASPNDFLKICSIYDCHQCMGQQFRRGGAQQQRTWHVRHVNTADVQQQVHEYRRAQQRRQRQRPQQQQHRLDECRCQWNGCYCRMDDRWQWRAFNNK